VRGCFLVCPQPCIESRFDPFIVVFMIASTFPKYRTVIGFQRFIC